MKFGCIFSICALLLISFPLFDAFVTCPSGNINLIAKGEKEEKNCSTSCAVYSCVGVAVTNTSFEIHDAGCVEDFFHDCAFFHNAIEFVNSTSAHEMIYFNGNVTYVSGCGKEINGSDCIMKKSAKFVKEIAEKKRKGILKEGEILTDVNGTKVTVPSTNSTKTTTRSHQSATTDASSVFVPEVTSKKPLAFNSTDPVTPSGIVTNDGNKTTVDPIGPVKKNTTVAPITSKATSAPTTRSSRIPSSSKTKPTTTTTTTTTTKTTSKPDLQKDDTTVAPVPASDTTPAPDTTPALVAAASTQSASNGQDKSFWKKIGCFTIGLILAAWIY